MPQEESFSFNIVLYNFSFARHEVHYFLLPRLIMSNPTTSSTSLHKSTASTSSTHAPSTNSSSSNRLSNGAVAGIVIGVALGIALLTFLMTFFIMRRQQSKIRRRYQSSEDSEKYKLRKSRKQDQTPIPKKSLVTEASGGPGTYENYLPQSADDNTVQQKAKAVLDQLELHVENFYQKSSSSAPSIDNKQLAAFDSPYLPASLATLLPRSKNRVNVIKHALALLVTSSISPSADSARSLLPSEFALLPNTVTKGTSSVPAKAGEFYSVPCEFPNDHSIADHTKDRRK